MLAVPNLYSLGKYPWAGIHSIHTQKFYSVFKSERINIYTSCSLPEPELLNARNKVLRMSETYLISTAIYTSQSKL